jgi:hypothetical protein
MSRLAVRRRFRIDPGVTAGAALIVDGDAREFFQLRLNPLQLRLDLAKTAGKQLREFLIPAGIFRADRSRERQQHR